MANGTQFDWGQVAANNRSREPQGSGDWDEKERLAVEAMRAEHAQRREQEQHERDVQAYAKFANGKAEQARKAADEQRAKVWDQAAANIGKGLWTVDKVIASDPAVTAYQGLRTTLLYQGKTAQLKGQ
jgi:hypothetical protein